MEKIYEYTVSEEVVNSITHGLGVLLGFAALIILTVKSSHRHNPWEVVSCAIFSSTVIILYLASTLYHSLSRTRFNLLFKTLDHSAIYLLIAGSYTPFCLVCFRNGWGWSLFGITWGLAIAGVIFKILFVERFDVVSTAVYVFMGWLALVAIKPMLQTIPLGGLLWIFAGGISYTAGVFFYAKDNWIHNHGIWHLFVLGGTICHFFAILYFVIPLH